jgi:hypothetical protein
MGAAQQFRRAFRQNVFEIRPQRREFLLGPGLFADVAARPAQQMLRQRLQNAMRLQACGLRRHIRRGGFDAAADLLPDAGKKAEQAAFTFRH